MGETVARSVPVAVRPECLTEEQIAESVKGLPGWQYREGALCREYQFGSFVEAFGFMVQAAMLSEQMNHHPNWSNVYSRVSITLSTHDAGGVTELDISWAKAAHHYATAICSGASGRK